MFPHLNQVSALVSVLIIDIVLAGDNAIVVGMAAAGLPAERRRRAIALGIAVATVLRILFAAVTLQLLEVIGLPLAGGVLLLWVAWKMYRELRESHQVAAQLAAVGGRPGPVRPRHKTTARAMGQIVLADLSMSLDNVIAVAGVAHTQTEPWLLRIPYTMIQLNLVLAVGLVLSVALMGIASNYIARLLERHFWISWVGLGIVTFVALRMIWVGSKQILIHSTALGF